MVYLTSNEPTIIKLQSHWKGYLARKSYKNRMTFIKEQLPAIIKIQVRRGWWGRGPRGFLGLEWRGYQISIVWDLKIKKENLHILIIVQPLRSPWFPNNSTRKDVNESFLISSFQSNVRGFLQRIRYRRRLKELKSSEQDVIKVITLMVSATLLPFLSKFLFFYIFFFPDPVACQNVSCKKAIQRKEEILRWARM